MHRSDKRVVLHVGAHKTGTTVIQQYLKSHAELLRRRGIRYVSRPELTPLVGWGEKLVDRPERFAGLLEDFGSSRDRVLLGSHENICGAPLVRDGAALYPRSARPIDALVRLLEPFDATVVLTIRPPHEMVESYYLQQVNLGSAKTFDRWLAGVDLAALSWRPLVDRLRDAFGEQAVVVVDFRGIKAGSVAYVSDVLRRSGIDVPLSEAWVKPLNASVSAQGLRLLLRGNTALADAADRAKVRGFVQRHYPNTAGERPVLLDAGTRASVLDRYGAEYAELVGRK